MPPSDTTVPSYPGLLVESDERVWDGRFPLHRIRFRHRRFDGETSGLRTWELWRRGRAATILPYDPVRDAVVLIEQFRLPALVAGMDPVMREAPAGLVDPGEDAANTATRELMEEAGLRATAVLPVGDFLLSPGGMDERCAVFLGRVEAPDTPAGTPGTFGLAAEHEDIRLLVIPAREAVDDALAGRVPNIILSLALLWFAARRDWVRREWA